MIDADIKDRVKARFRVRAKQRHSDATPDALMDAVDEHCRALAASAAGQVFSVPAENAEAAVRSEARRGARYDTVLSLMRTPQVPDVAGFVAALDAILSDEGWILMVEPAGTDGVRMRKWLPASLQRASRHQSSRGRDVVTALRGIGLVVTDVQRRQARSVANRWRRYVVLRARRPSPGAAVP